MTRRIALLALVALCGCQKLADAMKSPPVVLKSTDGALELTVPASWRDDSAPEWRLNEEAVLQASNRASELYVIVLSQGKEDLGGMDLEKFSEVTRTSQLQAMTNGVQEGPKKRTLNGLPAIEYVLKGTVDKANVVMKHVAVDSPKRYHQVLVWTLKSNWESQKATLDQVVESLKEVGAGASGARAPAP
jgi:hypothetical protein